jgi:lipid A 4'-phosphatase
LRIRADLLLLALCIALFAAFPQLDLTVTSLLHDSVHGFRWSREPLVRLPYEIFKAKHIGWIPIGLLVYLIATLFMPSPNRVRRRNVLFLLILIIAGPMLLVNSGLKDQWGRARPNAITQFGGDRVYTPPLQPAAQCDLNCSFVSGHAAAGFVLIGLYWTTRQRRWLAAGIALGSAVGVGRMLQGGHFLSDVVFAFWAVYLTGAVLAWLMLRPGAGETAASMEADA